MRTVIGKSFVLLLLSLAFALPLTVGAKKKNPPPVEVEKEASAPIAPVENGYAGSEMCQACHGDVADLFAKTTMGKILMQHPRNSQEKLGCEGCHGPAKAHADSGGGTFEGMITFSKKDTTPVEKRNAVCLDCHEQTARTHWKGSPHASRNIACTDCHRVMGGGFGKGQLQKPTEIETCGQCHLERKAQLKLSTHMPLLEGKMTCTSCHNPHGSVADKLLKKNTTNEVCYSCHAEKRGPFVWEHPPVLENCVNCHDPHGSVHQKMLKLAPPRLCQQCHIETRHPTRPQTSTTRFTFNRSCMNCHNTIHGSNHPSGRSFHR